ncbi:MAG: condensation domain-containing protein, partial [Bacteroidota bacterium]
AYLNRPELTREKFIPNPYATTAGARLYRTGDLARWLPDGNIEYKGRKDNQLKVNGFRVELGEVEYRLSQSPDILEAVVLAQKDQLGSNRLLAYVVTQGEFDRKRIERHLQQAVPAYLIPSFWVPLNALPISATGKVDRQALPAVDLTALLAENYIAPSTETEKQLVAIWQDLLELDQVGVDDHFFEIGGHSLLGVRLISAIRVKMGQELQVRDLFKFPKVRQLALHLDTQNQIDALPPLEAVPNLEKYPLSYAQERLWFVDQLSGSTQFHLSTALRLQNDLDPSILEAALRDLVKRHTVLRTVIRATNDIPFQEVRSAEQWSMKQSKGTEFKDEEYLRLFLSGELAHPFDLANDYLFRAHLIELDKAEYLLLLVIHHIATDGWSQAILVNDFQELYQAKLEQRKAQLTPLTIQYRDYAWWQRQYLSGTYLNQQLEWWAKELRDSPHLELPIDHVRPKKRTNRGGSWSFGIDQSQAEALKTYANEANATLFMTLLTVCQILLYRYSGQNDFCIGTSLANRNQQALESLVGLFVNSLVLRADLEGDSSFRSLLDQVQTNTLAAFAHQDVPFEKIVERLGIQRDLSRNPLFQVLFTFQNMPGSTHLDLEAVETEEAAIQWVNALYDLSFYVTEVPKGLFIGLVYSADLFEASTIKRMASHFQNLVLGIFDQPDLPIYQLPMLSRTEQQQLIDDLNQ